VAEAQAFACDKDVSLSAGNAGQAFRAGLIDKVRIDLVPVVIGAGVRYFVPTVKPYCCSKTPRLSKATG
jgi:hypothetical protein